MPSKEARELNEFFKNLPKGPGDQYEKEREEGKNRPTAPLPEGVTLKELQLAGNYAELIEKPGNEGPLVMYIHGGGYKTGAARERREVTFPMADRHGCNVIANDYRLAPENKWPAGFPPTFIAVSDAEALYDDSRILYGKLVEAGVKTELFVGHDLIHAFPIFPNLPEAKEALEKTFSFIKQLG